MKRYITLVLVAFSLFGVSYPSYYADPSDYSVVSAITKKSNITQYDVEKWKLVWLGSLQNIVATTAAGYSAYQLGQGAGQLASMAMTNLKITKDTGLLTHKWFWTAAGAASTGATLYNLLNPRLERGILQQVTAYADFCENLDVVKYWYSWETLGSMGTSVGNAAWATTNNIARLKGVENLLMQAEYALGLLDQLEDKPVVRGLRARIAQIKQNLTNNLGILQQATHYQLQERSMHMEAAQKHAHLQLTQEQTSALRIGKVSLAATAMQNFVSQGLKTLAYINDNKTNIAGGAVIIVGSTYAACAYAKAKLGW